MLRELKKITTFLVGEEFTTNEKGESVISYLDYAAAFLDQIETNTDNQVRISVRY